jgi:hypothetical protein
VEHYALPATFSLLYGSRSDSRGCDAWTAGPGNADHRRDKEIAQARSSASGPASLAGNTRICNGMNFGVSGGSRSGTAPTQRKWNQHGDGYTSMSCRRHER